MRTDWSALEFASDDERAEIARLDMVIANARSARITLYERLKQREHRELQRQAEEQRQYKAGQVVVRKPGRRATRDVVGVRPPDWSKIKHWAPTK